MNSSFELSYNIINKAYVLIRTTRYSMKETQCSVKWNSMAVTQLGLNPVAKDTKHLPVSIHELLINIVEGETKVLILQIPYIHWLRKKLNKLALTASRGSLPAFKELMLRGR
ncbi:unnamed protein product [Notodromas monacha]|uniref:Uncharacterized protein n=1 Tax=Notodromas monacha TaxID=399045 RepID=A0A7R9GG20_9CRUS|nr:unnamed protein product [Notodromas monacha]CAG0921377.1 unnamed protein product [Notodromas monacha]